MKKEWFSTNYEIRIRPLLRISLLIFNPGFCKPGFFNIEYKLIKKFLNLKPIKWQFQNAIKKFRRIIRKLPKLMKKLEMGNGRCSAQYRST
jgi:hypothetical protein